MRTSGNGVASTSSDYLCFWHSCSLASETKPKKENNHCSARRGFYPLVQSGAHGRRIGERSQSRFECLWRRFRLLSKIWQVQDAQALSNRHFMNRGYTAAILAAGATGSVAALLRKTLEMCIGDCIAATRSCIFLFGIGAIMKVLNNQAIVWAVVWNIDIVCTLHAI